MNYYQKHQTEINYLRQFYTETQIEKYTNGDVTKLLELYTRTQPKKVKIGSLKSKIETSDYLVSSPDGWVPVMECVEKIKPKIYAHTFKSGRVIKSSHDHLYQKLDLTWQYAEYLKIGDSVLSEYGSDEVLAIGIDENDTPVYDLSVNHPNHRYYTDTICSHNSGAGKSLFLANLGVNWALAGLNVVYLTLELSEELVSMRIDSMITGIPTRDVFKSLDDVEMRVKVIGKKSGSLQVKYMPSGKTVNDLRAYLKEYEIRYGIHVDVLLVDYLDLLMPISKKISPADLFIKDKYVSEELRNLAVEKNCVLVTASQLNRGAVEEVEFDHSHISGGLSKIQTADNVFGIFTSRAMRERGQYQIQLMKTRSSSGVGQKIDLDFNIDSLRISDLDEDAEYSSPTTAGSSVLNSIKQRTTIQKTDEGPKVKAKHESSKLRDLLNNLPGD